MVLRSLRMRQKSVKPGLELRLLGGFAALAQGRTVCLKTRKDRALLAYLALAGGRRHNRERLATLLWGDVEGDARHCLRQSLSVLSRALPAGVLQASRNDVGLHAAALTVDALTVCALLKSHSKASLERGIALYAGALLEGLGPVSPTFDDWLTIEGERLAAEVIAGHRRLLDLHAAAGTPERAIAAASRLVEVDPFREEARRELMLLYAECGHTRAAIAQYDAYAALLRRELGAEPDEATRQIHRLLVEGQTPPHPRGRRTLPAETVVSSPVSEFLSSSVVALEQMPDCVVITDLDGRIVGWNQWAQRNFGYAKREVVGRKPFFLYGPGGGEDVTARLIDKAVRYGRWSGVLRLFNKDGSSRLHKRTMMPLRDANGRVVGVFGVTRPLTRPIPGL